MDCKKLLILDEFLEYEPENKDDDIAMFNYKMLESSIRYIKGKEAKKLSGSKMDTSNLKDFCGYTIYRAEDGTEICGAIHDGKDLYLDWMHMECGNAEKQDGSYVVVMGDGKRYKW